MKKKIDRDTTETLQARKGGVRTLPAEKPATGNTSKSAKPTSEKK